LTAVVLVLGLGLAWHFRKTGEATSNGTESSSRIAPAAHSAQAESPPSSVTKSAKAEAADSADSPTARLLGASTLATDSRTSANGQAGSQSATRSNDAVPSLSASFPGSDRRSTEETLQPGIPFGPGSLNPSTPTHRIADGDTLAQLAARYLGSADRWRELYDFNRDVLTNPELLPIGAELRIPTSPFRPAEERGQEPGVGGQGQSSPAPPSPVNQSPAVRPVSQSKDESKSTTPQTTRIDGATGSGGSGLATSKETEPKVHLKLQKLPPFPPDGPALRLAPRTYTVQRGDTLNSIAERFYGDGAKESVLLEANRNLLANAQAVRPGMVLIIPADPAAAGKP